MSSEIDLKSVPSKKEYYCWIDFLKSVSIFGVVYIHTSLDLFNSTTLLPISNYFRFSVPVFITISFFLLERSFNLKTKNINHFLKNRILRLSTPFLFWSTFYMVLNLKGNYSSVFKFLGKHWKGYGFPGQYYFIVLIFLTLAYPLIRRIKITNLSIIQVASLSLLAFLPIVYFPLSHTNRSFMEIPFLYIFYAFFGIFLARNYERIRIFFNSISLHTNILIFSTAPILISLEEILMGNWDRTGGKTYFRVSTLIVSCLVVLVSIGFENFFADKILVKKFISYISSWSLGIFCLNFLFIDLINRTDKNIFKHSMNYIFEIPLSFLIAMIILFASILLSHLISYCGGKALVR